MGLPMWREPSPDASKSTIKVNTDSQSRARSSIRRRLHPRRPQRARPLETVEARRNLPNYNARSQADALRYAELVAGSNDGQYRDTIDDPMDDEPVTDEMIREFLGGTAPLERQPRDNTRDRRRRHGSSGLRVTRARVGEPLQNETRTPPQVLLTASSGLGDRLRSHSPEELPWEILRTTIPPDERLPSQSSSFASTAAASSASLSRERSMRTSPATSIDVPGPAISLYPSQRNRHRSNLSFPYLSANDDGDGFDLFICEPASMTEGEGENASSATTLNPRLDNQSSFASTSTSSTAADRISIHPLDSIPSDVILDAMVQPVRRQRNARARRDEFPSAEIDEDVTTRLSNQVERAVEHAEQQRILGGNPDYAEVRARIVEQQRARDEMTRRIERHSHAMNRSRDQMTPRLPSRQPSRSRSRSPVRSSSMYRFGLDGPIDDVPDNGPDRPLSVQEFPSHEREIAETMSRLSQPTITTPRPGESSNEWLDRELIASRRRRDDMLDILQSSNRREPRADQSGDNHDVQILQYLAGMSQADRRDLHNSYIYPEGTQMHASSASHDMFTMTNDDASALANSRSRYADFRRERHHNRYRPRRMGDRAMGIDELNERYADLQRQEDHLNQLIQTLNRGGRVPDSLWELAGVEGPVREGMVEMDRPLYPISGL